MYVLVNAPSSGDILYQCTTAQKKTTRIKNERKFTVIVYINSIFCQKRTMNVLNYLHAPTSGDILYLCIVLKKDDTKIKWKKLTVIVYINSIFCQRENDERFKIICNASGKVLHLLQWISPHLSKLTAYSALSFYIYLSTVLFLFFFNTQPRDDILLKTKFCR